MSSLQHVWPELEFGWRSIVGSGVGFMGAAMGSVAGVGGGAIFVPMLILIVGFDPKSSAAVSKCMVMGTAGATVFYNLRLRHPTLDMPLIDYDLALLFQPMLMVGISVGVAFNIIFADWMITILLLILFFANSTRCFMKGIETWKKETLLKQEIAKQQEFDEKQVDIRSSVHIHVTNLAKEVIEGRKEATTIGAENEATHLLHKGSSADSESVLKGADISQDKIPMLYNIKWKQLSLLMFVWVAFFAVQIVKVQSDVVTCSFNYWILNSLQVIIGTSVAIYQATRLYKGTTVIKSSGKEMNSWNLSQILVFLFSGILAGTIGGLLGIGGGTILTPLLLELGIPPQVASATSAFSMLFSSSMSVVQYYILKRLPVPYSAYLCLVAIIAAFTGQSVVRKMIKALGRTSIIIFILAFSIFVASICLAGGGIPHLILKLLHHDYMGFESMCNSR